MKQLLFDSNCRWWNLFLATISQLPAPLCVCVVKIVGKMRGII